MLKEFWKLPSCQKLEKIQKSPNYKNNKFQNINKTPEISEWVSYIDIIRSQLFDRHRDNDPQNPIPSIKINLSDLDLTEFSIVRFGHSSYLIHIHGKNILVDPVFGWYASPIKLIVKSYKGSNIYTADDMPEIDLLVITHDHYDHLDCDTVTKLIPKVKSVVTGLWVWSHLEYWWYDHNIIKELDRRQTFDFQDFSITWTPARHFSGRLFIRQQTLRSSFVLQISDQKIYIWGDSWYDNHFLEIWRKFWKIDFAILECWQYNKNRKYIHMIPEETVQAAVDLGAKLVLPVHWAKFTLSTHARYEPINRFTKQAKLQNINYINPMIWEIYDINIQNKNKNLRSDNIL